MSKDLLARTRTFRLLGAMLISLFAVSCTTPTSTSINPAIIKGNVVDQKTLTPLASALVQALPFAETAQTNEKGEFVLSVQMTDSTAKLVSIVISKTGFVRDTVGMYAIQANKTVTLPEVRMSRTEGSTGGGTSGSASNIVLIAIENSKIFVAGSGGDATSVLTFEVRDATGAPIDLSHQAAVNFRIASGPGGGETVSPVAANTNALGQVTTTVQSGTIAGPIQLVASIATPVVSSAPVPLSIHGGLPHAGHFSVVAQRQNFAGYNIFGLENPVTAFVGDRYSNPVPPATSVQFQSTGGIIGGSSGTDLLGRATVPLLAAAPRPQGITGATPPLNEPGFARITAETIDENKLKITASTVVLFSGVTQVSAAPLTFNLPPLQSQLFNYTVSDQNKNPLVAGTNISVSTDVGTLVGDKNIVLEDTQSRAYTQFSFVLTNANPDSVKTKDATVELKVTSQNGNANLIIRGTMLPLK